MKPKVAKQVASQVTAKILGIMFFDSPAQPEKISFPVLGIKFKHLHPYVLSTFSFSFSLSPNESRSLFVMGDGEEPFGARILTSWGLQQADILCDALGETTGRGLRGLLL